MYAARFFHVVHRTSRLVLRSASNILISLSSISSMHGTCTDRRSLMNVEEDEIITRPKTIYEVQGGSYTFYIPGK